MQNSKLSDWTEDDLSETGKWVYNRFISEKKQMIYRDVCGKSIRPDFFVKNTIVIDHFTKIIDKADIIKYNYKNRGRTKLCQI